jgi:hypothetical protein
MLTWKGRRSPVFAFGYAVAGRTEIGDQKSEAGAARVYSGTGETDHFFALT